MTMTDQRPLAILLADRAVIEVAGPDAASFLQGLVTNDVERLESGQARYAALLTPQGKLIADFFVLRTEDGFLIDVHESLAESLIKRLSLYRLRAKATVQPAANGVRVAAVIGAIPPGFVADPRLEALGGRFIGRVAELETATEGMARGTLDDYRAHRMALGVPETPAEMIPEQDFAHEIGIPELNGVDYKKGCFVGQEIVARVRHRATVRKRLLPVTGEFHAVPAPLDLEGKEIGTLRAYTGRRGFAEVKVEPFLDAERAGRPITIADRIVTVRWPAYLPRPEEPQT